MIDLPDGLSYHKSLPRLPSSDSYFESNDEEAATPRAKTQALPALPPSTPGSPSHELSSIFSEISLTSNLSASESTSLKSNGIPKSSDTSTLLSNLRYDFQQDEQSLYQMLSKTPFSNLNEVRRSFSSTARGAAVRLAVWQTKHIPDNKTFKNELTGALETVEPDWWKSNCHAIPGGNVVVREAEWGSIISFTLR